MLSDEYKLFCHVDSFCQWLTTWEQAKLLGATRKRGPAPRLSMSEVMTILIYFHQSHYRDFKAYYMQHVSEHMRSGFPALVSYTRFVELIPSSLPAMCLYLRVRFGQGTGVAFIDSTQLAVCHNRRIRRHRSTTNFLVNLIAGLTAYTWQPQKPSLSLSEKDMDLLPATF